MCPQMLYITYIQFLYRMSYVTEEMYETSHMAVDVPALIVLPPCFSRARSPGLLISLCETIVTLQGSNRKAFWFGRHEGGAMGETRCHFLIAGSSPMV